MSTEVPAAATERIEFHWEVMRGEAKGASHQRGNSFCQDYSDARITSGNGGWIELGRGPWAYVVVSDGHGSRRHFRSERGAKFATKALVSTFDEFRRAFFTAEGPDQEGGPERADRLWIRHWCDWAPRHVVTAWRTLVHQDLVRDPPEPAAAATGEPALRRLLEEVHDKGGEAAAATLTDQMQRFAHYANERRDQGGVRTPLPLPSVDGWPAERGTWQAAAYGATLLGVLIGPEAIYWLQLGDGAMAQVVGGEAQVMVEPPAEAIANETPSLCDDDAALRMSTGAHVLIPGAPVPSAVLLTTDGLPNSYADEAGFLQFCRDVAKLANEDRRALEARLDDWLVEISRRGSGDDMSVAMAWASEVSVPVEPPPTPEPEPEAGRGTGRVRRRFRRRSG